MSARGIVSPDLVSNPGMCQHRRTPYRPDARCSCPRPAGSGGADFRPTHLGCRCLGGSNAYRFQSVPGPHPGHQDIHDIDIFGPSTDAATNRRITMIGHRRSFTISRRSLLAIALTATFASGGVHARRQAHPHRRFAGRRILQGRGGTCRIHQGRDSGHRDDRDPGRRLGQRRATRSRVEARRHCGPRERAGEHGLRRHRPDRPEVRLQG